MAIYQCTLNLNTRGSGTYEISEQVVNELMHSGLNDGTVNIFCRHTSCSLMLMENADPSARHDLEAWLNRLVPEGDPHFTHTLEGDDDMPAHIKMALTRSSETIPFRNSKLLLGTWQGIFLWEHRHHPHTRQLILTFTGI